MAQSHPKKQQSASADERPISLQRVALTAAGVSFLCVLTIGFPVLWWMSSGANVSQQSTPEEHTIAALQREPAIESDQAPSNELPRNEVQDIPPVAELSPEAVQPTLVSGISLFELEHRIHDSAFDEESGRILVINHDLDQVQLFDTTSGLSLLNTTTVCDKPATVLAKRIRDKLLFAVGGELDPRIDVLDGASGELLNSITTSGTNIGSLAGNHLLDDPSIYYAADEGKVSGRCNLESYADEGALALTGQNLSVSADGVYVYLQTERQPVCVYSQELNEATEDSNIRRIHQVRDSSRHFQVDHAGAYCSAGTTILSSDLKHERGRLEFPVAAFVPNLPWAVGVRKNVLRVASINDFRDVAQMELPEDFFAAKDDESKGRRRDEPLAEDYQIYGDSVRQRLLVVSGKKVAVVPFSTLKLPQEPSLALRVTGPRIVDLSKPMQVQLTAVDKNTQLRILSSPDGMTEQNGTLDWTPSGGQVGHNVVRVLAKSGHLKCEYDLEIEVRRDSVPIPFVPINVALSRDATLAVVWGAKRPKPGERWDGSQVQHEMAVVDVRAQKMLATNTMHKRVVDAKISADGVFATLGPSGSNQPREIFHLKLDDLSLVKAVKTPDPVTRDQDWLALLDDDLLTLGKQRFSLPELTPVEAQNEDEVLANRLKRVNVTQNLGGMTFHEGVFWDEQLTKARLLVNPDRFIAISSNRPGRSVSATTQTKWGNVQGWNNFTMPSGRKLIDVHTNHKPVPLFEYPALALLHSPSAENQRIRSELAIIELQSGEIAQEIRLAEWQQSQYRNFYTHAITYANSVLAISHYGRLYFIPTSEIDSSLLKQPFQIVPQQDYVISSKGKTDLTYQIQAGNPPYQIKLTVAGKVFEFPSAPSGEITIDIQDLLEGRGERKQPITRSVHSFFLNLAAQDADAGEAVRRYERYVTPSFNKIVGRKPQGVPITVSAQLEVTDSKLQTDSLQHVFLTELRKSDLVKDVQLALDQRRNPRSSRLARVNRERQSQRASKSANTKSAPSPEEDLLPRKEREKILRKIAADYATMLLKRYPPSAVPSNQIEEQAEEALERIDQTFENALNQRTDLAKGGVRQWDDRKGHSTKAQLVDSFAEQVVLRLASGGQVTVPMEKLSDKDIAFANNYLAAKHGTRPTEYVPAQMDVLLRGLSQAPARSSTYVPAYLVDENGKPKLSWRVLILPAIGGMDLFRLFRLDQAWDSPHNRRLIKFMPEVYKSLGALDKPGFTTILALRGHEGLLADDIPRAPEDVLDPRNTVLVLGEVLPEHAVAWTQPEDLDEKKITAIKRLLNSRSGKVFVGVADRTTRLVPDNMSVVRWKRGINCIDGEPAMPQLELADPLSLSE